MCDDPRDARIVRLEAQLGERDAYIARLEARVATQEAQLAECDAFIAQLEARVATQEAQLAERDAFIARLEARVTAAEERLGKNSRNSSKPPSADDSATRQGRPSKRTGRRPGGQPGHRMRCQELVPKEKVRNTTDLIPDTCSHCEAALSGEDPNPRVIQTVDLPPIQPVFDHTRVHTRICSSCHLATSAKVPPELPRNGFGPGVVALIALLMGVFRLSKRSVATFLGEVMNIKISIGAVVKCQNRASQALVSAVADAVAHAQKQSVKNADETSWTVGRKGAWLWTLVTGTVTVFMIHARRTKEAARALLGKVAGVLGTDRLASYGFWPARDRQVCWQHLKRDFKAISERRKDRWLGRRLVKLTERLFHLWHQVRSGTLSRSTFRRRMRPVQRRVEQYLRWGTRSTCSKTAGTCAKILEERVSLWTFVRVPGVEPTNNSSERAVRHGVMLRKSSFGTHSEEGARFLERILTVHATLRQQGRHVLDFLRAACTAAVTGAAPPSLLPPSEVPPG